MLEKLCGSLDQLSQLYKTNDYIENMISSMILKFQIQHFSGKYEEANETKTKILYAIDKHGFHGLKKEYEHIFSKGTTHESFVKKYTQLMNSLQDSALKMGFDPYRIVNEKEINYKTVWSIRHFIALDFSLFPDTLAKDE